MRLMLELWFDEDDPRHFGLLRDVIAGEYPHHSRLIQAVTPGHFCISVGVEPEAERLLSDVIPSLPGLRRLHGTLVSGRWFNAAAIGDKTSPSTYVVDITSHAGQAEQVGAYLFERDYHEYLPLIGAVKLTSSGVLLLAVDVDWDATRLVLEQHPGVVELRAVHLRTSALIR